MKEPILYKILIPLDKLVMWFYRVEYVNKDYIPKKGGVILAGNHTANLDPLLLMSTTNRNIHYLGKIELFKGIKKYFFNGVGVIPVDRSKKNKEALESAYKCLNEGKIIGIFPEGTINRTKDVIMPFKYGAVKMASTTKTKIIPFAITGKYKFLRKEIKVTFGEAYNVTDDLEKENKILEEKVSNLIRSSK